MCIVTRAGAAVYAAVAAVAILAHAAPVEAQVGAKVRKACASDYKRLCGRYKVGSPQLRACMEAKQNELSWTCVSALIDSGEVSRTAKRR